MLVMVVVFLLLIDLTVKYIIQNFSVHVYTGNWIKCLNVHVGSAFYLN